MEVFLEISIPVPLRATFTYRYTETEDAEHNKTESTTKVRPCYVGARARVPFGSREVVGIILNISASCEYEPSKVKDVIEIVDDEPLLNEELLLVCRWASHYYAHPIGEVISATLPQRYREGKTYDEPIIFRHTQEGKGLPQDGLKRAKNQQLIHKYLLMYGTMTADDIKQIGSTTQALTTLIDKGLIEKTTDKMLSPKPSDTADILKEAGKTLSPEQQIAFKEVRYHRYGCYLVEGVTGSGKTELYLHCTRRVLMSNKQVLVLIPEIGLSAQTISRFKQRFNARIVELHSNVAEKQRAQSWRAAMTGEAQIIIGTRLASLTPFKDLGLIIIDEEHDSSYKQQDGFKYSARDLSVYRAHLLNIPIILGSATPSLESSLNAQNNRYQRLSLLNRAGNALPPTIDTVDLRNQKMQAGLSTTALEKLVSTLSRGEQAMLFINRRGFAPSVVCHACGWTVDCRACDTRMTYHKISNRMRCHSCDRSRGVPQKCANCSSTDLVSSGYGTEQLELYLEQLYPDIPVIRIDRDTTRRKSAMEDKLAAGQKQEACIFVGTQMMAKGHHLPNLTLVIIVDADQGLMGADFRSLEQMGQLITQVSGRAGREEKPGQVLVQTHRPDHPLLNILLQQGYAVFTNHLLSQRKSAQLPPFAHCIIFRSESKRSENSLQFLKQVRGILQQSPHFTHDIKIVGPAPSVAEKVNNRYRFVLQIFASSRKSLKLCVDGALTEIDGLALGKRNRWSVEVDPLASI